MGLLKKGSVSRTCGPYSIRIPEIPRYVIETTLSRSPQFFGAQPIPWGPDAIEFRMMVAGWQAAAKVHAVAIVSRSSQIARRTV